MKTVWLMAGMTYFYAVTAVDQHGRENRFSTVVRVEVPSRRPESMGLFSVASVVGNENP